MKTLRLMLVLAVALPTLAEPAATVTQLAGTLTARKADGALKILSINSTVESGDLLSTAQNAYARLKFTDGGDMTMRPDTQLKIDDYKFQQAQPQSDNAFFRLFKGGLRAITGLVGKRNGVSSYQMATPTATIGIRGTDYGLLMCQTQDGKSDCDEYRSNDGIVPQDGLHVDVSQGRIVVQNTQGVQEIKVGEFGYAGINLPPIAVPSNKGVPISTDHGINKPPEAKLGNQAAQSDFECTVE